MGEALAWLQAPGWGGVEARPQIPVGGVGVRPNTRLPRPGVWLGASLPPPELSSWSSITPLSKPEVSGGRSTHLGWVFVG